MPSIYRTGGIDVAGFAVGIVENYLPRGVAVGDKLYGIRSNGIHANGFSLVKKLFRKDANWPKILKPTRLYHEQVLLMKNSCNAIAHITGGGILGNLPRVLGGLTYTLDKAWPVPNIFKSLQKLGNLTLEEMLNTFNCGIGMIFVVSPGTIVLEEMFEIGSVIEGDHPIIHIPDLALE